MRSSFYIYSLLFMFSFTYGKSLNLVTDISMLSEVKNGPIDEEIEEYWLKHNGDFRHLPKRTIEFAEIKPKRGGKKIRIDGITYYKGYVAHSDQLSFTDNQLVDIYTMFNVIYSVQSHSDQFVVDPTMYALDPEKESDRTDYITLYIEDEYVPAQDIVPNTIDESIKFNDIYFWSSLGFTTISMFFSSSIYNQYGMAETTKEASALRNKSEISNVVLTVSLLNTTYAFYQRYKKYSK